MLEELVIGLVVTVVGALIIYSFRVKQLYVVVPRLFSNSLLTTNGKLVEIRVFNKARTAELDIKITLDPAIKYELVASTDNTSRLEKTGIIIPRLPAGDDYSVLLLVEGGDFNKERISTISSVSTKGKLLNKIEDVPPNIGNLILGAIGVIFLLAIPIGLIEGLSKWESAKQAHHLAKLEESLDHAWEDIERYSSSEFSNQYLYGEFPIHLVEVTRVGTRAKLKFRVINKAAAILELGYRAEWPFEDKEPEPWKYLPFKGLNVEPASTKDIDIFLFWPKGEKGQALVSFTMSVGDEDYLKAVKRVEIDV